MGRPAHGRSLAIWANGHRVGRWTMPARGPTELVYDAAWIASPEARPLSLSLPINFDAEPLRGTKVAAFFDNLLPDSAPIRQRLRDRFRTASGDAFDLLAAVGRDCVGAVQLTPDGTEPKSVTTIEATRLDDEGIEAILRGATSVSLPFGDDDEFRISIAGAQEKTALTWHRGRFCRPHGATPTTHIFKLPLGLVGNRQLDMAASLENEWLCGRILAALGVPVAESEVKTFGTTKALVVTRFDRTPHASGRYWLRLPQEDLCQATGTPSAMKYEADGGPGIVEVARILRASEAPDDGALFLRAQVVFWMLAATDGHAKNFSIRILAQGRHRMTPLYDVISAWPIAGSRHDQIHPKKLKLAMALRGTNKHYRLSEIDRRHFIDTARVCGHGGDMEPILEDVIAKVPRVIEELGAALPKGFPERVFASVTSGMTRMARVLEKKAR